MSIFDKFGLIYFLIPFIFIVENKIGLIFSIMFGNSKYKIKIKNAPTLYFESHEFTLMLSLLGILTFSTSYNFKNENEFYVSFDMRNEFSLTLDRSSIEDKNLINTLFGGIRYGADFVLDDSNFKDNSREKSFRIFKIDGRRIIETSTGIKFYLDSIRPGNTIVETYVQKIHQVSSKENFNGKVVIDVGAECGDTALFYSNLGATVYAFEPLKDHFDYMLENISLNEELSKKIIPINAAIGKDGDLIFNFDRMTTTGGSFVKNIHEKNSDQVKVKGYSFESALKKFNIECVDLLKMDCKGCECFLNADSLDNVKSIKIEYISEFSELKLEELLNTLEKAGFENNVYRINPISNRTSNRYECHIFGKKNN
tara:strand:+ start:391 stop:1497 length:1107 start_codon:yes stop_codon:yes gene_type:complete